MRCGEAGPVPACDRRLAEGVAVHKQGVVRRGLCKVVRIAGVGVVVCVAGFVDEPCSEGLDLKAAFIRVLMVEPWTRAQGDDGCVVAPSTAQRSTPTRRKDPRTGRRYVR